MRLREKGGGGRETRKWESESEAKRLEEKQMSGTGRELDRDSKWGREARGRGKGGKHGTQKDADTLTCRQNANNRAVSKHPSGRTLSTLVAWELGDLERVA